mmetsp:Transcript_8304/g.21031  ORF Transcript_8304/g.21031 Transcript_8304/m.21031 type:complete len:296 (+) Transcript_8304:117-1004(+)
MPSLSWTCSCCFNDNHKFPKKIEPNVHTKNTVMAIESNTTPNVWPGPRYGSGVGKGGCVAVSAASPSPPDGFSILTPAPRSKPPKFAAETPLVVGCDSRQAAFTLPAVVNTCVQRSWMYASGEWRCPKPKRVALGSMMLMQSASELLNSSSASSALPALWKDNMCCPTSFPVCKSFNTDLTSLVARKASRRTKRSLRFTSASARCCARRQSPQSNSNEASFGENVLPPGHVKPAARSSLMSPASSKTVALGIVSNDAEFKKDRDSTSSGTQPCNKAAKIANVAIHRVPMTTSPID